MKKVLLILISIVFVLKVNAQNEMFFYKFQADSLYKEGLYSQAVDKYKQVNTLQSHVNIEYVIAICYCKLSNPDSAAFYLNSALKNGLYYT